ncbi:MAG: DUF3301 domain-containing protein [Pseudomonadota bacterium]
MHFFIIVVIFGPLAYGLWHHFDLRRIAYRHAQRYCLQAGVQFLDQTIVLEKFSIARSTHSLLTFKRCFVFEFAAVGDRRYRGRITVLDGHIDSIELEPFKTLQQD